MRSFGIDANGRSLVANSNNNNNNNNNNVPDVVLLDDGVDVKVDLVTYDDRDVLVANMIDQVGGVNYLLIYSGQTTNVLNPKPCIHKYNWCWFIVYERGILLFN